MRYQILTVLIAVAAAAAASSLTDDASEGPQRTAAPPRASAAAPPAFRVAAVQMRSTRDLAENVTRIRRHLERCKADGVRVAVFPECALTGYFDADYFKQLDAARLADAERQVCAACRELDLYAVVGTPTRDGDKLFNS